MFPINRQSGKTSIGASLLNGFLFVLSSSLFSTRIFRFFYPPTERNSLEVRRIFETVIRTDHSWAKFGDLILTDEERVALDIEGDFVPEVRLDDGSLVDLHRGLELLLVEDDAVLLPVVERALGLHIHLPPAPEVDRELQLPALD